MWGKSHRIDERAQEVFNPASHALWLSNLLLSPDDREACGPRCLLLLDCVPGKLFLWLHVHSCSSFVCCGRLQRSSVSPFLPEGGWYVVMRRYFGGSYVQTQVQHRLYVTYVHLSPVLCFYNRPPELLCKKKKSCSNLKLLVQRLRQLCLPPGAVKWFARSTCSHKWCGLTVAP